MLGEKERRKGSRRSLLVLPPPGWPWGKLQSPWASWGYFQTPQSWCMCCWLSWKSSHASLNSNLSLVIPYPWLKREWGLPGQEVHEERETEGQLAGSPKAQEGTALCQALGAQRAFSYSGLPISQLWSSLQHTDLLLKCFSTRWHMDPDP